MDQVTVVETDPLKRIKQLISQPDQKHIDSGFEFTDINLLHSGSTSFVGDYKHALVGLYYLKRKFELTDCVIIPNKNPETLEDNSITLRRSYRLCPIGGNMQLKNCSLYCIGAYEICLPNNFEKEFQKCRGSRFILFTVTLEDIKGLHVVICIYFAKEKILEIFDPNTETFSQITSDVYDIFFKFMKDILPGHFEKLLKPLDYCPKHNVQVMNALEQSVMKGDPEGFCGAWIIWYAEQRLSNPGMDARDVITRSLNEIEKQGFTNFIRRYSKFLNQLKRIVDVRELSIIDILIDKKPVKPIVRGGSKKELYTYKKNKYIEKYFDLSYDDIFN
jgi:hypothetical protein